MSSCCFTGHRAIPDSEADSIIEQLEVCIKKLIDNGVTKFYCGGAIGFDTIAAIILIKYRTVYPQIKLLLALPCTDQDKNFSSIDKAVYKYIKSEANDIYYAEQTYRPGCMFKRNRYLVDNSNYCVCYLNKSSGGTAYTVKYALSNNKKMIYIK